MEKANDRRRQLGEGLTDCPEHGWFVIYVCIMLFIHTTGHCPHTTIIGQQTISRHPLQINRAYVTGGDSGAVVPKKDFHSWRTGFDSAIVVAERASNLD